MNYDQWKTNEPEEQEFECSVCGKPIDIEGICNSRVCFEADNM